MHAVKSTQVKETKKHEKINQTVVDKEERLKGYRDRIKLSRKNRTFENNWKNSTSKWGENSRRHINNQMTRKQSNFAAKYGNEESIKEKPNG